MRPAAPSTRALLMAAALLGPAATFTAPTSAFAQKAARSHASPEAESFVQTQANRVIDVLQDRGETLGAKKRVFRSMIDQVADVPRITGFVLGKYRRSLSPEQQARFGQAFKLYAYNVYESRLSVYAGQKLEVTGSVERRPGDVIVSSRIVGRFGAQSGLVQWRVVGGGGGWRVVDVNVGGVWLSIVQQQDFVSTLDNNGGNVDALIAQMQGQGGGRG